MMPDLVELHVGIDDTDSRLGGCTTYTAALVFEQLVERNFTPLDFPWLVRLNPNIPWKTRGNGALALHFLVEKSRLEEAKAVVRSLIENTTDLSDPFTDPALVFLCGKVPRELVSFSEAALHDVVRVQVARSTVRHVKADVHVLRGSRGLVGALASLGAELPENHTYEIIAYRTRKHLGTPRQVDEKSVREMDAKFAYGTFNNVDTETGRILVCPHGPDPVLFGIRGEDPEILTEAFRYVRVHEPVERVMIFRTNHGTDAHLGTKRTISEVRPYQSAVVTGIVDCLPKVVKGGHIVFSLRDPTGCLDCAAYEPTGSFRKVVKALHPGDHVKALGGIRRGPGKNLTINLEKIEIKKLVDVFHYENPRCLRCERRCESMGRGQGFRCRKCRLQFPRESLKSTLEERSIQETVYIPPPRANRHLTKPLSRYSFAGIRDNNDLARFERVDSLESLLRTIQAPLPS